MSLTVTVPGKGLLRQQLELHEKALFLLKPAKRNQFVRGALVYAGMRWAAGYLPKRFTHYVERAPFSYPSRAPGFLVAKARRMGILKKEVLDLYLQGWDPWKAHTMPEGLFLSWLRRQGHEYGMMSRLNRWTRARKGFKKWGKDLVRKQMARLAASDKMMPLVESGKMREAALRGVNPRVTATQTKATLRINIPRLDRQNWRVNRILSTFPSWERQYVAKHFGEGLAESLAAGKPLAGGAGQRKPSRAHPRDTSTLPKKG